MAPTLLLSRSSTPGSNADTMSLTNPIYIAGFVLAGVLSLGVATWLALRLYRQRVAERRESKMGAAFLSVKGLRPEGQSLREKPARRVVQLFVTPQSNLRPLQQSNRYTDKPKESTTKSDHYTPRQRQSALSRRSYRTPPPVRQLSKQFYPKALFVCFGDDILG